MKKHTFTILLTAILFVLGIIQLFMLLVNIKTPSIMTILSTILILSIIILGSIKNKGSKSFFYPSIVFYFLIVIPIIGKLISNNILYIFIVIASFITTIMLLYNNFVASNKLR